MRLSFVEQGITQDRTTFKSTANNHPIQVSFQEGSKDLNTQLAETPLPHELITHPLFRKVLRMLVKLALRLLVHIGAEVHVFFSRAQSKIVLVRVVFQTQPALKVFELKPNNGEGELGRKRCAYA